MKLSDDDELLMFEPHLEDILSRTDSDTGAFVDSWAFAHRLATRRIEQLFQTYRTLPRDFSLGRVGERSIAKLKDCATFLALHYIYASENIQNSDYMAAKAKHYLDEGLRVFRIASNPLEYDVNGNGVIEEYEIEYAPITFLRHS